MQTPVMNEIQLPVMRVTDFPVSNVTKFTALEKPDHQYLAYRNTPSLPMHPPRLADALAEDYPAQQTVAAAGDFALHSADVSRLHRRQVALGA